MEYLETVKALHTLRKDPCGKWPPELNRVLEIGFDLAIAAQNIQRWHGFKKESDNAPRAE